MFLKQVLLLLLFVIRAYYCHLVYDPHYFNEHQNLDATTGSPSVNVPGTSTTPLTVLKFFLNIDVPTYDEKPSYEFQYNQPEAKYSFRDFFKPTEYYPMYRGGSANNPDNTFISTTTEHYDLRRPTETSLSKAKYWCKKYQTTCKEKEEDSSDLRPRIIGGSPAAPREHTHMVSVGYGSAEDKRWLCGGSLISPRFILSAAHCTTTSRWGKARWARLGDLDLASRTEDASPQEKVILQHFIHPDYKEPAVYNDIALFKLDSDVTMTNWVSPICLQTNTEISETQVIVTGWGRTGFVSETSSVLMEVKIGLYNDSECRRVMEQIEGSKLPRGIDSKTMMCAGVQQGGKDACTGDSGGPLITETSKCTKVQVGITSIGRDCGLPNTPGIYTRISYYIPWIESIVWK